MNERKPTRKVRPFRMTRRELLKAAQVSGLFAAAGGLSLIGRDASADRTARGPCRLCTMHCGLVATTRGDELVRVEGDLDSATRGFLCLNGQALPEIVHSTERVRRPLKRSGTSFDEVSWEEALGEIAERLRRVKARHGARALALQTGWPFVRSPLIGMLHRFCQAFGTPNLATTTTLCEAAGRMGRTIVAGSNFHPDLRGCRTLVVWGANPTLAAPPFAHAVAANALRGKNLIVIDPVRTELAERATLHLQVRPGTDGALALGMIHVIVRDGLHDSAFVDAHTVGFGELARLAEEYPTDRVASLTGLAEGDIVRAATIFAGSGPSQVWDGLGIEHHENGIQTVRAVASLQAICGNLDAPGGPALMTRPGPHFREEPLPALWRMTTPEPAPPPVADKPIGWDERPLFHVYNRQAQANLFPRAMLEGRPYPLRALFLFGCNTLVTYPDSRRLRRAYDRLDLLVTIDPFLTETASRSDYVLPACTFAEAPSVRGRDDRVAKRGLVGEQHESRPDWRIVFDLARELGLGRYFPWQSLSEALEARHVPFMRDPEHTLMPDPGGDREAPRFPTASGKVELYSETMQRFGHDPLPRWTAPSARTSARFPLWLVSGPRTRAYINSQFRQIPSVAAKMPEPLARIHPEVAAGLGVEDGDRVAVVSGRGRIELRARVDRAVERTTVVIPSGWPEASANELTDGDALDPISGFPALRSTVCRVERLSADGRRATGDR
ncbi:MAG: molybdopterin-dependent oxidoreductase [Deltaproteobacteria bacterium]|nr:molybdopterin-dependent oxidoreductase [Deltaproteobacteria bacterium]